MNALNNYACIMLLRQLCPKLSPFLRVERNMKYIWLGLFCSIFCTYNRNIFLVISVRRFRVLQYSEMEIKHVKCCSLYDRKWKRREEKRREEKREETLFVNGMVTVGAV